GLRRRQRAAARLHPRAPRDGPPGRAGARLRGGQDRVEGQVMREAAVEETKRDDRSVAELASELGSTAAALYERLDLPRQMREHPYRTLAVAAGVGYVLGGGLFTPLTAALVRVGARAALLPVLQSSILAAAEPDEGGRDLF